MYARGVPVGGKAIRGCVAVSAKPCTIVTLA